MRTDVVLGARYRSIVSLTGLVLALCGAVMLSPLLALLWWPGETRLARGFILPGLLVGAVGVTLWRALRPRRGLVLSLQDGGVIVLVCWVAVTVVSAIPLMVSLDLDFTPAFFESVSGWTTTGLSVLDVDAAPRVVLLWRSVMQLAGGAGMAIILVTLAGGPLGPGVAAAEGRADQLVPHVQRSARLVLTLYASYAVVGTGALRAAGMSWFDAVNHAFPAVSTGGFSTHGASVGHWDSALIEGVLLPLMILGNLNFQVVYLALRGRPLAVARSDEVRTFSVLTLLTVPLVLAGATAAVYTGLGKQVRVAVFEVVSALTTTGFSTSAGAVYRDWPALGLLVLIVLMLIGGGTGSTAGGIKQHRAYLLARAVGRELRRLCLPARVIVATAIWRGDERVEVSDRVLAQTAAFVVAYLAIYTLGAGVLVASGFGLQESLFEYASALGTVGLSVGVTSARAPAVVLWAEIVGMLLGRLEIFIVVIALRKLFSDGATALRGLRR